MNENIFTIYEENGSFHKYSYLFYSFKLIELKDQNTCFVSLSKTNKIIDKFSNILIKT